MCIHSLHNETCVHVWPCVTGSSHCPLKPQKNQNNSAWKVRELMSEARTILLLCLLLLIQGSSLWEAWLLPDARIRPWTGWGSLLCSMVLLITFSINPVTFGEWQAISKRELRCISQSNQPAPVVWFNLVLSVIMSSALLLDPILWLHCSRLPVLGAHKTRFPVSQSS